MNDHVRGGLLKMKSLNIGILGGSFCCPNFGVGALTISQCNILDSIAVSLDIVIKVTCYEAEIQNPYLQKYERINVTLDTHTLNISAMRKKLARHDIIIELYGGDSFADIYSVKGFIIGCCQRSLSLNNRNKYFFAPQTVGPFRNTISQIVANKLMKRADSIFCRDSLSLNNIPEGIRKKVFCVTDMAFKLPYDMAAKQEGIGLNVSGLLWNSSLLRDKRDDYRDCIIGVIEYSMKKNIPLTIVPHVNDIGNSIDGDYAISKTLSEKYDNVKLAPAFKNPVEAKSYISQFDFFIGSRMHATIAASSMGIPTLAIAYSKKFDGLYRDLDYKYVIPKENINRRNVCKTLDTMIHNWSEVKAEALLLRKKTFKALAKYEDYLKGVIEETCHE